MCKSFDVVCVQCPFACLASSRPVWIEPKAAADDFESVFNVFLVVTILREEDDTSAYHSCREGDDISASILSAFEHSAS